MLLFNVRRSVVIGIVLLFLVGVVATPGSAAEEVTDPILDPNPDPSLTPASASPVASSSPETSSVRGPVTG